jgi:hypothetical protein
MMTAAEVFSELILFPLALFGALFVWLTREPYDGRHRGDSAN